MILYPYRLNDPMVTVPSWFPLYPEDPNHTPSPPNAVIPSRAIQSAKLSGMLPIQSFESTRRLTFLNLTEPPDHKPPEHESINLTADDHVPSTSLLGSPPSAHELELDNYAFPHPLCAVMRSHITSLHATLAQRARRKRDRMHSGAGGAMELMRGS